MKLALAVVLVVAACGDNKKVPAKKDDAALGEPSKKDAAVDAPTDAPPLLACTPQSGTKFSMRLIGAVSGAATLATSPPNDGRLFVLEQQGRIRVFQNEQLLPDAFLDLTNKVHAGGEQGLLGLAFHPQYAQNGYFYVFYTQGACVASSPCTDVLERYHVSANDLNKADPASGQVILSIPDFAVNHNGGMIEFGNDGYLYVSTGDGGGGGDPHRNAQAISRTDPTCIANACEPLLGKILRLDVDHPSNGKMYGIPADNPFANGGGEPEIFIIGLRNPWRWSFDRATGDMWIADVGQLLYEELDLLPAGHQAGVNLGWSMYEGSAAYGSNYTPDPAGKTFPIMIKRHNGDGWHAAIGGQVYRGPCYPDITGWYFWTDFTWHSLSVVRFNGTQMITGDMTPPTSAGFPAAPSSLHADARGELYWTTTSGTVFHLEAGP